MSPSSWKKYLSPLVSRALAQLRNSSKKPTWKFPLFTAAVLNAVVRGGLILSKDTLLISSNLAVYGHSIVSTIDATLAALPEGEHPRCSLETYENIGSMLPG
ncbi:hypothetical protein GGU11DRAFT_753123 [Lentinula aff. detonsa]|uniref:Uncharacterized protein n=1 Tax=Lentinula aff. detonsa TaxID=2804958 RepID=A0AA38KPY7_9AGAR|nr:hypothetical protein GGU10DRAFT_332784 [Lentinula aff. detonsa]KAJ3802134.1 hypothetical protein GGU11DRAFT_753123 [Lentinula aff. detonsa]